MSKPLQSVLAFFLLILAGCAIFVSWRVARTLQSFDDAAVVISNTVSSIDVGDVGGTVDRLNATLDAINAPCTGFHGSSTCGVLAQAAQTEKNIGIVAGQAALQVRQTGTLIQASTANLDKAGKSVTDLTTHLTRTADAATDLTQELTTTIRTVNDRTGPLLDAYTQSGNDLDALLKDHAVHETLDNVNDLTQNMAGVTLDLRKASDKATADYLRPVKWYMQPVRRFGEIWDIGAAVARHTP